MTTVQIEFHVINGVPLHSGAAYVHHCLLRVWTNKDLQDLMEESTILSGLLGQLSHLETLTLETGDIPGSNSDNAMSLFEVLRKVCAVEVRHRTCDEAHKLALRAKNSKGAFRSTGAELLSPLWCMQAHSWKWNSW